MISYDDALLLVLSRAHALPAERVSVGDALGCVLASDVLAPIALPSFANSQMDGYALSSTDWANGQRLFPVTGTVAAGDTSVPALLPGHALRIMTGAPLPDGADTVVPHEDTDAGLTTVNVHSIDAPGQYIRHAGEDIRAGDMAVVSGTCLRPLHLGLLSALGLSHVSVHRRPRVALFSTGDELTLPGGTLMPGAIFNSNFSMLAAQVAEARGVLTTTLEQSVVRDSPEALRAAFASAAGADVVLTSGGVSVGAFDHVRAAWEERGTLEFWRVAIRPGKPLAYGLGHDGAIFFGLPGNPLSAAVTFALYVRPVLRALRGLREVVPPALSAVLTSPASHEPGRRSFVRGAAHQEGGQWFVTPLDGQGSHRLAAAAQSNALVVLSEDRARWDAGESVPIILWN